MLNYPKAMDDDNFLQALVWKGELGANPNMSAMDFLRMYAAGAFTAPETSEEAVRNCKREEHLRGHKYKIRHEHQEPGRRTWGIEPMLYICYT